MKLKCLLLQDDDVISMGGTLAKLAAAGLEARSLHGYRFQSENTVTSWVWLCCNAMPLRGPSSTYRLTREHLQLLLRGAQAWFPQSTEYGPATIMQSGCAADVGPFCIMPLCHMLGAMLHHIGMQPAEYLGVWRQVHVAYQTSGAIAVWDHDARRFAAFARHLPVALGLPADAGLREKLDGVAAALESKRPGEARPGTGSRICDRLGVSPMSAGISVCRSQLERHRC